MTAINSNRAIRGPVTAVPVVAGKGVRLREDVENNRVVAEADETVLFEGVLQGSNGGTVDLAERLINFERIRITYKWNNSVTDDVAEIKEVIAQEGIVSYWDAGYAPNSGDKFRVVGWIDFRTPSKMSIITAGQDSVNGTAMGYHGTYGTVYKVVGINRIASN